MYWIHRSPEAEYYTRLSPERAIASLERAMAENLCRGAATTDYVAIHLPGSDVSPLPSFHGQFEVEPGVTILSGYFQPARRAQLIFAFWAGTAFALTALSGALAGPQVGALLLAVVAVATWSLLRAASRAMERGVTLTGKLIESAFQPLASPSLVLLARRRKPAA